MSLEVAANQLMPCNSPGSNLPISDALKAWAILHIIGRPAVSMLDKLLTWEPLPEPSIKAVLQEPAFTPAVYYFPTAAIPEAVMQCIDLAPLGRVPTLFAVQDTDELLMDQPVGIISDVVNDTFNTGRIPLDAGSNMTDDVPVITSEAQICGSSSNETTQEPIADGPIAEVEGKFTSASTSPTTDARTICDTYNAEFAALHGVAERLSTRDAESNRISTDATAVEPSSQVVSSE